MQPKYEEYMTNPEFRRLQGEHQEFFIESIIKQTHFREFNRAFKRHNESNVSENDFWSAGKMKVISENLDLCSLYKLPVRIIKGL